MDKVRIPNPISNKLSVFSQLVLVFWAIKYQRVMRMRAEILYTSMPAVKIRLEKVSQYHVDNIYFIPSLSENKESVLYSINTEDALIADDSTIKESILSWVIPFKIKHKGWINNITKGCADTRGWLSKILDISLMTRAESEPKRKLKFFVKS